MREPDAWRWEASCNKETHTHMTDSRCCKVQDSLCLQTRLSVRECIKRVFAMVTASTTVTDTSKGESVHCRSGRERGRTVTTEGQTEG